MASSKQTFGYECFWVGGWNVARGLHNPKAFSPAHGYMLLPTGNYKL